MHANMERYSPALKSSYSKLCDEHVGDAAQYGDEIECVPFIAKVVLERDVALVRVDVGATTYSQAECDDLHDALDGEERSECGIRIGEHVVVRRRTSVVLKWRVRVRVVALADRTHFCHEDACVQGDHDHNAELEPRRRANFPDLIARRTFFLRFTALNRFGIQCEIDAGFLRAMSNVNDRQCLASRT